MPFPADLFQDVHPNHQVLLSWKPHRPGCHQWRPIRSDLTAEIKELQPDVIVECYLEAKYYHYEPMDMFDLVVFNKAVENLIESDDIVTIQNAEADEYNLTLSLNDNFQELEKACPEWQEGTRKQYIQNGLKRHQSGHPTKDPGCPVCMEEAGSKVSHCRRKGDRQPGIMHCDLAAFEPSADGHKYGLVAAVTIELDKESKLLPIFIPMPKKDATCASTERSITLCQDLESTSNPGRRRRRIHHSKVQRLMLGEEHHTVVLSSHQPSSIIAERMVGILKSTVRRMLKQAHLEREWWSLRLSIRRPCDEREKF